MTWTSSSSCEKRAEADGMDVGNPFLGGRRIRLSGTVYGKSRGALL
jgi:hypothetical protein